MPLVLSIIQPDALLEKNAAYLAQTAKKKTAILDMEDIYHRPQAEK